MGPDREATKGHRVCEGYCYVSTHVAQGNPDTWLNSNLQVAGGIWGMKLIFKFVDAEQRRLPSIMWVGHISSLEVFTEKD